MVNFIRFCFLIGVGCFLSACAVQQNRGVSGAQNLTGLFRAVDHKTDIVMDVPGVDSYFANCCKTYQQAIAELEKDGFKVIVKDRASDPEFFIKHEKILGMMPGDSVRIYAKKIDKFMRLYAREYNIKVYASDKRINRAYGIVKYAFPSL